jgi:hypothetical protein
MTLSATSEHQMASSGTHSGMSTSSPNASLPAWVPARATDRAIKTTAMRAMRDMV